MKTRTFWLGMQFGLLAGSVGMWCWRECFDEERQPQSVHYCGRTPEEAAQWLLPKEAGVGTVFPDDVALKCVLSPDTVTLHLADANGSLKAGDHRFSPSEVAVSYTNLEFLKRVWESPNAYLLTEHVHFPTGRPNRVQARQGLGQSPHLLQVSGHEVVHQ